MRAKTFIVGGGIAIALAALYLDQRGIRAEVMAQRAERPKAGSERAEHGRPERPEVVWRRQPVPSEPSATSSRDGAAASSEPTQRGTQQKPPETPIEQFALVHDTLEEKFVSQASDGGWAMEARRSLETRLADLPAASRIRSIECRSTLCRMETIHDRYADARDYTSRFASIDQRPWNGGFYTGPISEDPQNGAVTFVTYLVREGTEMTAIPDRGDEAPASR